MNMKIVFATENKHKIEELTAILAKYFPDDPPEILTLRDVGITEEIVEDGETFEQNAIIKARVAAKSGYIGIGDDSGLVVEALGGAPGIFSARYAGEHGNDKKNNAKLLADMQGIADRKAKFVCAVACRLPERHKMYTEIIDSGECEGVILDEERGENGFGYDPLFYLPEYEKTFAELTADEKNSVSHRARAVEKLARDLSDTLRYYSIQDAKEKEECTDTIHPRSTFSVF